MEEEWTLVEIEGVNVAFDEIDLSASRVNHNAEEAEVEKIDHSLAEVNAQINDLCLADGDGSGKDDDDSNDYDDGNEYDIYGNIIEIPAGSLNYLQAVLKVPELSEYTEGPAFGFSNGEAKQEQWKPVILVQNAMKKQRVDRSYGNDSFNITNYGYNEDEDDDWFYESITLKQSNGAKRCKGLSNSLLKYQTKMALK